MAGIDLTTFKELMGQNDIKMTLRYAHLAPHRTKKAVQELDKFLGTVQKLGKMGIVRNV